MLHSPFRNISGLALACGGLVSASAAAQAPTYSISGQLNVQIELVDSCKINNNIIEDADNDLDFGTINFGTHTTFFTQQTAAVTGGYSSAFTILCSPGIAPKVAFNGGASAGMGSGGGIRAMTNGANYVTYNLLNGETAIPINTPITLLSNGTAQSLDISGIAFPAALLTAGTYTDIVTVTLTL